MWASTLGAEIVQELSEGALSSSSTISDYLAMHQRPTGSGQPPCPGVEPQSLGASVQDA